MDIHLDYSKMMNDQMDGAYEKSPAHLTPTHNSDLQMGKILK